MRNLVFIALFFVYPSFAQVSVLPFYSLSFEKQGTDLKKRMSMGMGFSYNLNNISGVGLQVREGELWRLNSKIEEVITLKTFTGQFYVHGTYKKQSDWLFCPVAGVLGGIVTQINPEYSGENKGDFLKNPVVFGVFSEIHFVRNLSKNFCIGTFFKIEGDVGLLRNRKWPNENVSTAGFLSAGLRLNYNFRD